MHSIKQIVPVGAPRCRAQLFEVWADSLKVTIKFVVVHRASPLLDLIGWVEIAYNDDAVGTVCPLHIKAALD